jgi:uncharacterized protein (TIGR02246 family)
MLDCTKPGTYEVMPANVGSPGADRAAIVDDLVLNPSTRPLCNRPRRRKTGPDEREIREAHSAWTRAVDAGDFGRSLTLMADDAAFLSPDQAPCDPHEFSAYFWTATQRFQIRCSSELEEVVVIGEVAYTRSRDALSVVTREGEDETRLAGHRITIDRRQTDGRWRLARDAHRLSAVADP